MIWYVPGLRTGEIHEIYREVESADGQIRWDARDRLLWRRCAGGAVEIVDIVVGSERGKGRGTWLINELKEQADTHFIFAFVRASNEHAIRFYAKNGLQKLGEIQGFYADENAVIVGCSL